MFGKIKNQFKRPSGFMGGIISRLMEKGNKRHYDIIIPEMNLTKENTILEIGYGPGIGLELLSKKYPGIKIDGIDFSELMYNRASLRNGDSIQNGTIILKYGDFLNETLENEKYDRIFCINVIYFWEDISIPFKKILHGLKPGGMYCLFMAHFKGKPDKDKIFNTYTIDVVMKKLLEAGFSDVQYKYNKGYYIKAVK
jgi:ubiquinone/menaquinone biosynthesis C-methylase UbiE